MPCKTKKTKRKRQRKRRTRTSYPNQMVRMVGDTAKLAIGTAAVVGVTSVAVSALKK